MPCRSIWRDVFGGWLIVRGMKQTRSRKCRHCGTLYTPDYRNRHHQRYCSKAACRAASRTASRRRWLNKPQNRHYHAGEAAAQRVQAWRKAHPGYWRRKKGALQDICSTQPVAAQSERAILNASCPPLKPPLQDLCLAQDPLFVGVIAHLTGALQEDIALQIVRFQTHGQRILRKGPGIEPERSRSG